MSLKRFTISISIDNMRQNGHILPQDPSLSPTFALSQNSAIPTVPPSLRRNLFASHLSRRPAVGLPDGSSSQGTDPFITMNSSSQHSEPQQQYSIFQSTSQQSLRSHALDPRASSHSLSPKKIQQHTSASIIALDPTTGRPQLPIMPILPQRLRLSEDDEDEEEEDDISDKDDAVDEPATWNRSRGYKPGTSTQHDLELHSSSLVGLPSQASKLHELIDASSIGDYEKIESILSEMQSLQKARARTAIIETTGMEGSADGISARTRGKSRATTRSAAEYGKTKSHIDQTRIGGVGAILKQSDKEELLSLIMTSLARKVQEADEDAWMFGNDRMNSYGYGVDD